MATTYTASMASGYMTDVSYANQGPMLLMMAHYVAPDAATAIIETGMFNVILGTMEHNDIDTVSFSAGANGTYAFVSSGHAGGDSGIIMVWGY